MTDNYEYFKQQILQLTGIDLNCYKEGQMKRRIDALILRNKCNSYADYVMLIKRDSAKFEQFVNYLTINVSEFWRNPEQWNILEKDVLPQLLKKPAFKVWSAACSTGDEPYSLAMLFSKYLPINRINITATDIDKQVLAQANLGIYNEKSLKGLPLDLRTRNMVKINDSTFQVSNEIKKCVTFKEHNLLKDPYLIGCDLILCRNVLIYFTEEAKADIYTKFNRALNPGGILFIGSTEQILYPERFGFKSISSFFYRKEN